MLLWVSSRISIRLGRQGVGSRQLWLLEGEHVGKVDLCGDVNRLTHRSGGECPGETVVRLLGAHRCLAWVWMMLWRVRRTGLTNGQGVPRLTFLIHHA